MKTYYFGCIGEAGHYLHDIGKGNSTLKFNLVPFKDIDGGLCPKSTKQAGIVNLHHKDNWTAFAFWDYSIDKRPGSNSVFFAEGIHDFERMFQVIKYTFPEIIKRFDFPLRKVLNNNPNNKRK